MDNDTQTTLEQRLIAENADLNQDDLRDAIEDIFAQYPDAAF